MDNSPALPYYRDGYPADFAGDLRTWVFKHKTDAALYFHLHHTTIGRYEKSDGDGLKPPLGYLACLAVLFVELQKGDIAGVHKTRDYLLKEINKVVRTEYFQEEIPFKDWNGLVNTADTYIQERRESRDSKSRGEPERQSWSLPPLLVRIFHGSLEGIEEVLQAETTEGPLPAWPRILVALFQRALSHWSVAWTVRLILWIWVWLLAWACMALSLRWPFSNHQYAFMAMDLFVGGTLILPLLIGILTDTRNSEFWYRQPSAKNIMIRLYTYQGAWVGFLIGYFVVFLVSLVGYYINLRPGVWFELLQVAIPLLIGVAGARLVPHNLWLAYGRLNLIDGGIFFFFLVLGPLWGIFLFSFYQYLATPLIGITIILFAITIAATLMAKQYKKTGT